ncbi:MAG: macro domain-containing protein [Trueperaceae bacterium]
MPARRGLPMGGALDMLVTMSVDFPAVDVDRKPLDLALVIDRSGSMSGAPLAAAKRAAEVAVGMLMPGDRVAVVAYETGVDVVVPATVIGARHDLRRVVGPIRAIRAGGTTALYAGWAEGLSQVLRGVEDGDDAGFAAEAMHRVVLLSDGMANVGPSHLAEIAPDVASAARLGVSTTTLGFGTSYDEDLLRGMADAGLGNYVYIEDSSQLVGVFEQELAGLSALRGRNVRLTIEGGGATLTTVTRGAVGAASGAASGASTDGRGLVLPDLVAGLPRDLLVRATFDAVAAGEPAAGAPRLVLGWDDVLTDSRGSQVVELHLPWVEPGVFEQMPTDERVAAMVHAARLADMKEEAAEAARRRDFQRVQAVMSQAQHVLAAMPAGDERDQQTLEIRVLEQHLNQRAYEKLSRTGDQFSRNFQMSAAPEKRADMASAEREWRAKKAAFAGQAAGAGTTARKPAGSTSVGQGASGVGSSTNVRPPAGSAPAIAHEAAWARRDGAPVRVQLVVGDITEQAVDAIVNSSNRGLFGKAGVDGAIHRRGGPQLTEAARSIGGIDYGQAAFTPGFALPATYVIHTATPPWGVTGDELGTLARCYHEVFDLAGQLAVRSIALPAIGTGTYQYPVVEAAQVAVQQARDWVTGRSDGIEVVRFVVVGREAMEAYRQVLGA